MAVSGQDLLPPGTLLRGKYRIEAKLVKGGQGTVYKAVNIKTDSFVAIKKLDQAKSDWAHEAHILKSLQHQSLPKILDSFDEGYSGFLVMEFIPGATFEDLINTRTEFSIEDALLWLKQLLVVLQHLSSSPRPIIHRDIKPSNLKLRRQDDVVLLDFGGAKDLTVGTVVDAFSLDYAPIEQIERKPTDARSDIFALSATFHHLLTGTPPPRAPERREQVDKYGCDPLRPVHEKNPDVPLSLSLFLQRGMALEPKDRFQNAQSMLRALEELAGSTETHIRVKPQSRIEISLNEHNGLTAPIEPVQKKPTKKADATSKTQERRILQTEKAKKDSTSRRRAQTKKEKQLEETPAKIQLFTFGWQKEQKKTDQEQPIPESKPENNQKDQQPFDLQVLVNRLKPYQDGSVRLGRIAGFVILALIVLPIAIPVAIIVGIGTSLLWGARFAWRKGIEFWDSLLPSDLVKLSEPSKAPLNAILEESERFVRRRALERAQQTRRARVIKACLAALVVLAITTAVASQDGRSQLWGLARQAKRTAVYLTGLVWSKPSSKSPAKAIKADDGTIPPPVISKVDVLVQQMLYTTGKSDFTQISNTVAILKTDKASSRATIDEKGRVLFREVPCNNRFVGISFENTTINGAEIPFRPRVDYIPRKPDQFPCQSNEIALEKFIIHLPPTPSPSPTAPPMISLEVCATTGLLPVSGVCPRTAWQKFVYGKEPTEKCSWQHHPLKATPTPVVQQPQSSVQKISSGEWKVHLAKSDGFFDTRIKVPQCGGIRLLICSSGEGSPPFDAQIGTLYQSAIKRAGFNQPSYSLQDQRLPDWLVGETVKLRIGRGAVKDSTTITIKFLDVYGGSWPCRD